MLKRLSRSAAMTAVGIAFAGGAAAQTTIDWLYVENNPDTIALWEDMVAEYEAANPDVDVSMQFLENEAYKAKLPALLQSDEAPDMFYSWGGGVLDIQRTCGFLRPSPRRWTPTTAHGATPLRRPSAA